MLSSPASRVDQRVREFLRTFLEAFVRLLITNRLRNYSSLRNILALVAKRQVLSSIVTSILLAAHVSILPVHIGLKMVIRKRPEWTVSIVHCAIMSVLRFRSIHCLMLRDECKLKAVKWDELGDFAEESERKRKRHLCTLSTAVYFYCIHNHFNLNFLIIPTEGHVLLLPPLLLSYRMQCRC